MRAEAVDPATVVEVRNIDDPIGRCENSLIAVLDIDVDGIDIRAGVSRNVDEILDGGEDLGLLLSVTLSDPGPSLLVTHLCRFISGTLHASYVSIESMIAEDSRDGAPCSRCEDWGESADRFLKLSTR